MRPLRILLAVVAVSITTAAFSNEAQTTNDSLTQANALFDAGSYGAAADAYAQVPQAARTRDVRLRQARALAWSGQLNDAERVYSQLLKEQPSPDIQLAYGNVLAWMGASRAAVTTLSELHRTSPSEDSAVALANAKAWSGNREGAIAVLDDFVASHSDASKAKALAEQLRASPELRIEQAGKLITAQPYNLALRVHRGRLYYESGHYGEALRDIEFVRAHTRGPVEELDALEQNIRTARSAELKRLDERRDLLDHEANAAMASSSSSSTDELLALAKAYTGAAAYDQAARLYDRYLTRRPGDDEVRLQYARVLSWDKRWNDSERQYVRILEREPDRADVRLEYAQVLSYDSEFAPAMHVFRSLTDLQNNPRGYLYGDVPLRARYNIGQIYRWYGWNEHAIAEQNAALRLDPNDDAARTELDLVRHARPATTLDARYTYVTDSSDFTMKRIDLEGGKWTSNRTRIDVAIGRHEFEHAGEDVYANVFSGGAAYRYSDRWTGRARVGFDLYDHGLGTRPFFGAGAEFLPNLQSRAAFDFNHYDLVYDVFTLNSLGGSVASPVSTLHDPLSINDFRAHYDYNSGGFLSWLGDASYGFISDDNNRAAAHGLVTFRVLREPFLAFKVDGRYLRYDFRSNRYWSPTDYKSLAGVIQIGQNVRDRFHWNVEVKAGRAYEGSFSSDLRAYEGSVTVPLNDTFDVVGNYGYGKSGRIQSLFPGSNSDGDAVNYWQRHWYVGVRVKQLFAHGDAHSGRHQYYYDSSVLSGSPVIPPLGESH